MAGLAGLLLLASVAACGGSSSSSGGQGDGETDPNGTINIAYTGPATLLDPHKQAVVSESAYTAFLYDRLTDVSPDGNEVLPRLATEWTFAPDGTSLTLKLRDDVKFHDGTPFNAEAVKVNIERAKTVDGTSVDSLLESIDSVEVVDDVTAKLVLKGGGGAELLRVLAGSPGAMISPKAIAAGTDLNLDPRDAGSGPYELADFESGSSATFERADGYWDDVDRAKTVKITYVVELDTRRNGMLSGQYDLILTNGEQIDQDLVKDGRVEGFSRPLQIAYWVYMNSERGPLTNLAFRQAVNYAIDRESISKFLYESACKASYQPYAEGSPNYSPKLATAYEYDPEKAKQLLAESGVSNPKFTIETASGTYYAPAAEAIQDQLADVGITVEIKPITVAEIAARFAGGDSDAILFAINPGIDPSILVNNFLLGGLSLARSGGPASDAIKKDSAEALNPSLSAEERGKLYQQVQESASSEAWNAQICSPTHLWTYAAKVQGVDQAPGLWLGVPDLSRLHTTS